MVRTDTIRPKRTDSFQQFVLGRLFHICHVNEVLISRSPCEEYECGYKRSFCAYLHTRRDTVKYFEDRQINISRLFEFFLHRLMCFDLGIFLLVVTSKFKTLDFCY